MPTIAYLGPEHTNTHVAAQKQFGPRAKYVHAPTIDDVFERVEWRRADYGVVPIENSLEGAVTHTLDRFIDFRDSPAKIQGEIEQPIQHALILHVGVPLSEVQILYSHSQVFGQCREWIESNLPHHPMRYETLSTSDAITYLADAKKGLQEIPLRSRAAIGRSELLKGRRLRCMPIPYNRENKTRFLILGLGEPKRGTRNKTSILFALKDRPGALYDALMPFKREKINLTKIESRPSKKKAWEYYFFIDVEGHESEPRVKRALKALSRSTLLLRVLGSYPVTK